MFLWWGMKKNWKFIIKNITNIYYWFKYGTETKEHKGLPDGCWHCELLGICRAPKEQGWKCCSGCLIINEKKLF